MQGGGEGYTGGQGTPSYKRVGPTEDDNPGMSSMDHKRGLWRRLENIPRESDLPSDF